MHHFIFPVADTYITNRPNNLATKNFGVDEILQVGTQNLLVGIISPTTNYLYQNAIFNQVGVEFFNGTITGSILGTTGSSYAVLTPSGSNSGSIYSGLFEVDNFTGSISSGSTVCLYGTASGIDTRQERSRQYLTQSYADRALLQFDITAVSQSIATGDIVNPYFYLKVKVCKEFQLPIKYAIYAAPLSESWTMGNGYMSDGGSATGASWIYRDAYGGTQWTVSGGTYISSFVTQSFNYDAADIDMDVTPIVNQWLTGLPNFGFLIISSDEFNPDGNGFLLKYFSQDTNTIYSPVLDVGWDDSTFTTGSILTGSVQISYASGSNTTVQTGSSLIGGDGVFGNFTASVFMTVSPNYITASNVQFTGSFIEQFTGSFSGSFYGIANGQGFYMGSGGFSASFSGSVDGTTIQVTSSAVTGSNVAGYIINDVTMPSYLGTYSGSLQATAIAVMGIASGTWLDQNYGYFMAFFSGSGLSGNIFNIPVWGPTQGWIALTNTIVSLPSEIQSFTETSPMESPYSDASVGAMFPPSPNPYEYVDLEWIWGGDDCGWSSLIPVPTGSVFTCSCGISHSVQLMTGSFTDGPFDGCCFTAYYSNYQIIYGALTGSWSDNALFGTSVIIPLPQQTYPYVTAYINGEYIEGTALGLYTTSGSYSASFYGQFTSGQLLGDTVAFQLSGSATTGSYAYTSSVQISSSVLTPLNVEEQFSINLTNLQAEYKSGDIIKLNVFGRIKFPLKYFGISTQQEQYLIPQYLPSSSYYALKDNQTDEIVVNFDTATKISCAYPDGNYFLLDTTGLPQERYYRILIRVEDGTISDTIDTGKIFKIVR